MTTFAMTGVAGFVAPRHLQAIKDVGGKLVAALDPSDSVGILDRFDRETQFFTSPERFERFLSSHGANWLSVCSPNHLHDVHARLGMQNGANVICEKPLCLSPWNLDALEETEQKTGKRVFTVLQLRYAAALLALGQRTIYDPKARFAVQLNYVTPRGAWYHASWKGDTEKSGGLITNIGIHMLDLLLWLYGSCNKAVVTARMPTFAKGLLQLERADVSWRLSIDPVDGVGKAYRSLIVDGERIEFGDDFTGLHTRVYAATLSGRGLGIADARPAIELAHRLRHMPVSP